MISKRQEVLNNCWIAVNSNDYKVASEIYKDGSRRYGRRLFGYWLRLMITNGLWLDSLS